MPSTDLAGGVEMRVLIELLSRYEPSYPKVVRGYSATEIVRSPSGTRLFEEWRIGCPSLRCLLLDWGFIDLRMVPLTARAHMSWRPLEGSSQAEIKAQVSALMLRQHFTYLDVTQTPALDLYERGDCAAKVHTTDSGLVGLYLAGRDRGEVERIAETMLDNVPGRAWRSPAE